MEFPSDNKVEQKMRGKTVRNENWKRKKATSLRAAYQSPSSYEKSRVSWFWFFSFFNFMYFLFVSVFRISLEYMKVQIIFIQIYFENE